MICVGHTNVKSRIKGSKGKCFTSWEDGSVGKAFAVHSCGPEFRSLAPCQCKADVASAPILSAWEAAPGQAG